MVKFGFDMTQSLCLQNEKEHKNASVPKAVMPSPQSQAFRILKLPSQRHRQCDLCLLVVVSKLVTFHPTWLQHINANERTKHGNGTWCQVTMAGLPCPSLSSRCHLFAIWWRGQQTVPQMKAGLKSTQEYTSTQKKNKTLTTIIFQCLFPSKTSTNI